MFLFETSVQLRKNLNENHEMGSILLVFMILGNAQ